MRGFTLPAGLPERWVVDCKAVGDGQAALRYLGRYLYRGVISERDIKSSKDGLVTFRYRDFCNTTADAHCACCRAMVILKRRLRPDAVPPCAAPQTERPDKAGPVEASKH